MQNIIDELLDKIYKKRNESFKETLSHYPILISDIEAYRIIKTQLGKDAVVSYSPYLSKDHKIYVVLNKNNIFPVLLMRKDIETKQNIDKGTYDIYFEEWLEAGGIKL